MIGSTLAVLMGLCAPAGAEPRVQRPSAGTASESAPVMGGKEAPQVQRPGQPRAPTSASALVATDDSTPSLQRPRRRGQWSPFDGPDGPHVLPPGSKWSPFDGPDGPRGLPSGSKWSPFDDPDGPPILPWSLRQRFEHAARSSR